MSEKEVSMRLELPGDVKAWLRKEAARMCSSQRAEIVRLLCQKMESEQRA